MLGAPMSVNVRVAARRKDDRDTAPGAVDQQAIVAPTGHPDRHGNAVARCLSGKIEANELELRHFARLALRALYSTFCESRRRPTAPPHWI
jgi:hypothetical protein